MSQLSVVVVGNHNAIYACFGNTVRSTGSHGGVVRSGVAWLHRPPFFFSTRVGRVGEGLVKCGRSGGGSSLM